MKYKIKESFRKVSGNSSTEDPMDSTANGNICIPHVAFDQNFTTTVNASTIMEDNQIAQTMTSAQNQQDSDIVADTVMADVKIGCSTRNGDRIIQSSSEGYMTDSFSKFPIAKAHDDKELDF